MRVAYFDCASGIAGDMCVASLLDAGADFTQLQNQLNLLPLDGYQLSASLVHKRGLASTAFSVHLQERVYHPHRHLKDIETIISSSSLDKKIKEKSLAIFYTLAQAEAKVHGTTIDKVHFHEVGAVDAIIDIVGSVICLSLLGVEKVVCSPLPMGHGFVKCAHGLIPVPAPATQEILKNIPVYGVDVVGELVTPTGAAIMATLAETFGPYPAMVVDRVGFGAGQKDFALPNIVRVSVGQETAASTFEQVEVLETTIDDMNPEFFSYLWERVFALGALDMFLVPAQMKKGRPGTLLTVLCRPEQLNPLLFLIMSETSTLGVRIRRESRLCAQRQITAVSTPFGEVKVKFSHHGSAAHIAPEYEDCRRLALEHKVPLKEIYLAALHAAEAVIHRDSR